MPRNTYDYPHIQTKPTPSKYSDFPNYLILTIYPPYRLNISLISSRPLGGLNPAPWYGLAVGLQYYHFFRPAKVSAHSYFKIYAVDNTEMSDIFCANKTCLATSTSMYRPAPHPEYIPNLRLNSVEYLSRQGTWI